MITQSELEKILEKKEDVYTEFKESSSESILNQLSSSIAAFANAEGGRIILGVDNSGIILGCEFSDQIKNRIAQEASNCKPPVTINIERLVIDGKNVIIVEIPNSNKSVYQDKFQKFPKRIGLIRSNLDIIGLMDLFKERFGLTYIPDRSTPTIKTEIKKREPMKKEELDFYLEKLNSSKTDVRLESCKVLESIIWKNSFLDSNEIRESLKNLLNDENSDIVYYVLEILRTSFYNESRDLWNKIKEEFKPKIIDVVTTNPRTQIRRDALTLLLLFKDEESIDVILDLLIKIDDSSFGALSVNNIFGSVRGYYDVETLRKKTFALLESDLQKNLKERLKSVLESVRYG